MAILPLYKYRKNFYGGGGLFHPCINKIQKNFQKIFPQNNHRHLKKYKEKESCFSKMIYLCRH
jgi:hypothetical protein